MNRNKIIGCILYLAGFIFVIAMATHYKEGGLVSALLPILLGGFSFCTGSVFFYLSRKK